jgi:Flp pilus assembly protein TadD
MMHDPTPHRQPGSQPWARAVLLAGMLAGLACFAPGALADDYADVLQLHRGAKHAEALKKADLYLVGKPRDPQMRFLKGVILSDTGKQDEALAMFTKLTEDFPELPEPYNNLAVIYAAQSQYDRARVALEMAVRTNPGYATAHENLGDVYLRLAGQSYAKSLQLDPAARSAQAKLKMLGENAPSNKDAKAGAAAPGTKPAPAPVKSGG